MNADIKQMIAEKTEFLLADDGNNIDQEERIRAIEELRELEMVQTDSGKDEGAEKSPEKFRFCTWYPIETAPKDGTPVLLFWPFITQDGFVISGYWYDPKDAPGRWYSDLVNGGATQPRHWMPLPPPPEEQRGDREVEPKSEDSA